MSRLADAEVHAVGLLVEQVTESDAERPLSEEATLQLRRGATARHVLVWHDTADRERLVGYGQVGTGPGAAAELAVHPQHRRRGLGRALLRLLESEAAPDPLSVWAHGNLPAAAQLAQRLGCVPARTLLRLRRSLPSPLPAPRWPAGITVRTFRLGQDEPAWLEVNRRAFTALPDQGGWGRDELDARLREPWFDPSGFFLAYDDAGRLAGFHWTKIHPADAGEAGFGEVYVIGVDPDYGGLGLGRALTLAGLAYLRDRGLAVVTLYVDAGNTGALALYRGLGFSLLGTDVQYVAAPDSAD
ncbi:MAG: mycothiol synthase [Actinomycetota bacterium]|nr:MAG: mycothiol synthase [Actinomycetota bacterium]